MKKDIIEEKVDDIVHDLEALDFNSDEAREVVRKALMGVAAQSKEEGRKEIVDEYVEAFKALDMKLPEGVKKCVLPTREKKGEHDCWEYRHTEEKLLADNVGKLLGGKILVSHCAFCGKFLRDVIESK